MITSIDIYEQMDRPRILRAERELQHRFHELSSVMESASEVSQIQVWSHEKLRVALLQCGKVAHSTPF